MNPLLRRSAAHVFVTAIDAPLLTDDDHHHLARVLRLRAGEQVSVSDGSGSWRMCRFADSPVLDVDSAVEHIDRAMPLLTIGFALPKGDRPEWIVQKLTEIGIDHIVLLHTDRSVVRWQVDRAERSLAKLHKVAREASMQSRRVWLPTISGPLSFAAVTGAGVGIGAGIGIGIGIAEPQGAAVSLTTPTVLIGPEGGWAPHELSAQPTHVGLGKSIMRVETAALVAAAHLSALRDGATTF